ncbi:MAG: cobalamin adenosyltransferase [Synergistaceae bacterium]|jgi:ethanolamine utilization cobalamin adenosyltransferase|nr:cobalamin adenosyltransferase [Synergistaceae bacterium]
MKILNENMLRAALLDRSAKQYYADEGTFVTPLAREYLRDRGIELVFRPENTAKNMPYTPIPDRGEKTYVDFYSGAELAEKPERMTHLFANRLVDKTHPRIEFRGKLDTLQGELILTQTDAHEGGKEQLVRDLGEILSLARELLGAEVTGRPLKEIRLFGYDSDQLRNVSHNVTEHFGFQHPTPSHEMGRLAARLNLLRAKTREAELAAEHAFAENERGDILKAMNRLSSAVYILFCRLLAGEYGK